MKIIMFIFCTLGAFLVNTGSCQLLDDCAVKQLLIDGTIAGCAIDGAEGPQWMEAWVWISFPFVFLLPMLLSNPPFIVSWF